jgi:molybdopterin synthase catalytic subunit
LKAGEAFNFVIDRSVFDRMDDPERTDNSKKKYRVNPKVSKKVLKRARDNAGSASGAGARPAMGTRAGRGDAILHVGVFAKKRAEAIAAKSELAKKLKLDKKEASSAVDGLGKRWFC